MKNFCAWLKATFHHILVKTGQFLHQPFTDLGQGDEGAFPFLAVDHAFKFQFTQGLPDDCPADLVKSAQVLFTRDLIARDPDARLHFFFQDVH